MFTGLITFAAPWLLVGLAALPVIWWLLRLTPPAPARVVFPAARLLQGLRPPERTPARSPWWLTMLRILTAALIILALSGPLYNPGSSALPEGRTVLLVIDNGWAAASRWDERQKLMTGIIRRAGADNQALYLAPTAGAAPSWRPELMSAEKARAAAASLQPLPIPVNRAQSAQAIDEALRGASGFNVIWLSDGLEDGGSSALTATLEKAAAGGGSLTVATDASDAGALGLYAYLGPNRQLTARVLSPGGDARAGFVYALSGRGERLGQVEFAAPSGGGQSEASFALPVELQNQVARLEIAGQRSAGSVYLLDSRSLRHRVAIISGEALDGAQPLLSPTHYIEKALSPFSEIVLPAAANVDAATAELLKQNPTVIVLADIGRLAAPVEARLRKWVEEGGLLIRFAGVRTEQGGDGLMPVRLREGGRTLGGALSWSTPQKLGAFEKTSPFFGLPAPGDIAINRQILADPSALGATAQIWARLGDGTPLVTADKMGDGRVVLFHVTGNPDWSNLPLSGVFVDMLRRTLDQAVTAMRRRDANAAGSASPEVSPAQSPSGRAANAEFLAPWRTLNGFGELAAPPAQAKAAPAADFAAKTPAFDAPPGYYGPPGQTQALNLMNANTALQPANAPSAASRTDYARDAPLFAAPWLFLAALALFAADALISMLMLSGTGVRRAARSAAAIVALAGLAMIGGIPGAGAQTPPPPQAETAPSPETIDAGLQTRLAYVITGDDATDRVSRAGLAGLSRVLAARTAIEPAEPMGVDIARDELSVFPLLYWAVPDQAPALDDAALAKLDAYMKTGGLVIFDTRDYQKPFASGGDLGGTPLGAMLAKLDVPRLEPVTEQHVVTKSFYILRSFPGRWDGGELWVEAQTNISDTQTRRALKSDGVSSILVTSNDLASAWALDDSNRPLYPAVPGGEEQREMAYRAGVNIVMYALTGNYKADQVHIPALLERLGH